jgi:hypothetical protein
VDEFLREAAIRMLYLAVRFRVRLPLHAEVNNTRRPRNRLLHSCTEGAEYFGRKLIKRNYFALTFILRATRPERIQIGFDRDP